MDREGDGARIPCSVEKAYSPRLMRRIRGGMEIIYGDRTSPVGPPKTPDLEIR